VTTAKILATGMKVINQLSLNPDGTPQYNIENIASGFDLQMKSGSSD